ncbi:MAG: hypothetical protein RLP02_01715, partial [Coleofasciculus sp. C2-GNP5-27]
MHSNRHLSLKVPQAPKSHPSLPLQQSGPTLNVYLGQSELFPSTPSVNVHYWDLLQTIPIEDGIASLAFISNRLSISDQEPTIHSELNQYFLDPAVVDEVERRRADDNIPAIVFNRAANVALMRNLLVYGKVRNPASRQLLRAIGPLAACANDFLQQSPTPKSNSTNLDFTACFIDTWDLYNPRETAFALPRIHSIINTILSGTDPIIVNLR